MRLHTEEQRRVVEKRIEMGYVFFGNFVNLTGLSGTDVCLVKGVHRIHINVLGYDSFVSGINHVEVK